MKFENYMLQKGTIIAKKYRVIEVESETSFDINYICEDVNTGQYYLAKESFIKGLHKREVDGSVGYLTSSNKYNQIIDEYVYQLSAFKSFKHPGFFNLIENVEDNGFVYIINEFVKGAPNLGEYLKTTDNIDVDSLHDILSDILDAIKQLHLKNIAHGNIITAKIYLCSEGKARVLGYMPVREINEKGNKKPLFRSTVQKSKDIETLAKIIFHAILPKHLLSGKRLQQLSFSEKEQLLLNVLDQERAERLARCVTTPEQMKIEDLEFVLSMKKKDVVVAAPTTSQQTDSGLDYITAMTQAFNEKMGTVSQEEQEPVTENEPVQEPVPNPKETQKIEENPIEEEVPEIITEQEEPVNEETEVISDEKHQEDKPTNKFMSMMNDCPKTQPTQETNDTRTEAELLDEFIPEIEDEPTTKKEESPKKEKKSKKKAVPIMEVEEDNTDELPLMQRPIVQKIVIIFVILALIFVIYTDFIEPRLNKNKETVATSSNATETEHVKETKEPDTTVAPTNVVSESAITELEEPTSVPETEQTTTMVNLIGLKEKDVKDTLIRAFQTTYEEADESWINIAYMEVDSNKKKGTVCKQELATKEQPGLGTKEIIEGETLQRNAYILVSISKGNIVSVPNVKGMKKKAAINKLNAVGLSYKITNVYSKKAKGTVISQSISSKKDVKKGKKITLKISKGKKKKSTYTPSQSTNQYNYNSTPNKPKPKKKKKHSWSVESDDWVVQ